MKDSPNLNLAQTVCVEARSSLLPAIWTALCWLLCTGLLFALGSANDLDSDEGVVLNGAWNLIHGRVPYTDFFEFVAPGSFYLVAFVWKIFGPSYAAAKVIGLSASLAAACAVGMIGQLAAPQRSDKRGLVFLFGPLAVCLSSSFLPPITHNNFGIALVIWSAFFVVRSIQKRSVVDSALGGVIAGIAVLFTQHRAVFGTMAVAFFIALAIKKKRLDRTKAGLAFAAAALLAPAILLSHWPTRLLVSELIEFPALHYVAVNQTDPYCLLFAISIVASIAYVLRHQVSATMIFLFATQLVLLVSTLQRPDLSHVAPALFPALCVLPSVCMHLKSAMRWSRCAAKWSVCCLMIPPLLLALFRIAYNVTTDNSNIKALTEDVKAYCSSIYLYAGPFEPGLYFETQKLSPTRFSYLITGMHSVAQFEDATMDIKIHRPDCAITNYEKVRTFRYDARNVLDQYIAANYKPISRVGAYQLLVLRR